MECIWGQSAVTVRMRSSDLPRSRWGLSLFHLGASWKELTSTYRGPQHGEMGRQPAVWSMGRTSGFLFELNLNGVTPESYVAAVKHTSAAAAVVIKTWKERRWRCCGNKPKTDYCRVSKFTDVFLDTMGRLRRLTLAENSTYPGANSSCYWKTHKSRDVLQPVMFVSQPTSAPDFTPHRHTPTHTVTNYRKTLSHGVLPTARSNGIITHRPENSRIFSWQMKTMSADDMLLTKTNGEQLVIRVTIDHT